MHARGGLKTPYLSEEWMECIQVCCEEAKKLGMNAWAYDENGWPSGFVGGKLLESIQDRDMYLLHKIAPYDAQADVSYRIDGEHLVRVHGEQTEGEYLNLYLKRSVSSVDILNPAVVDKFLAETHCKYKSYFGEQFAKKLKGFFTDEPQYYRWATPYTPMVAAYFEQEYQEDILEYLGLLFVEKEGYRQFRYRYWCAMQKLMLENYAKKLYDWCEQNGVKITGHYVEEVSLGYQVMCCGGVMPFYEYEHVPGIDWLGRETDYELSPRQLGSVARQLGKKQAMSETFGCCGWDVSPTELRRIAGFQYANGVNQMCHHLVPYSEHGQRKRDYPVHFNTVNPWVEEHFKEFNDYFTMLGYLMGTGKELVNVAMLHPMRSAYFDYKREQEEEGFGIRDLEEDLRKACRTLSSRGIAYHFLDETILEKHGFVEEAQMGCGKCQYKYLVLPRLLTMGTHTEELISKFVENGGKVLLLHESPRYLEGVLHEYGYLKSNCTLGEIEAEQPFHVENTETELYCAYRTLNGVPFLFLQNASKDTSYTQTFSFANGCRSFVALDLLHMQKKALPLTVTLQENESILLFPVKEQIIEGTESKEYELYFQNADVEFAENYMTVNIVRYSKDGVRYSEPMYRSKLFDQLLEERYRGLLWIRYDFEIQTLPDKLVLMAEREDAKQFWVNGQEIRFSNPWSEEASVWEADITSVVREGANTYEVLIDWHQSEATYYALFTENVTENLQNCIAYDSEIEAIYLKGHFGVYSHDVYAPHDAETVCAHDFYIGEIPKKVSEPTIEGFPFFRGKLIMQKQIRLDGTDWILKLPGRYLSAKIYVNGQFVEELFFERRVDISSYLTEGDNDIKVEFVIGNRNLMGPFHCDWPEDIMRPGLFALGNLPKSSDGHLQYRLYRFYAEKQENNDFS